MAVNFEVLVVTTLQHACTKVQACKIHRTSGMAVNFENDGERRVCYGSQKDLQSMNSLQNDHQNQPSDSLQNEGP